VRRRYRRVEVLTESAGFRVALDDRPLRTPAKHVLALPSRALAEAVAGEWRAQETEILPATMPLTRLSNTAIDRIADRPGEAAAEIAAYAETDLLCYRADHPQALARRQHLAWQPVLDWLAGRHHARLRVTHGVVPVAQDACALAALGCAVEAYDAFRLAALGAATRAAGSIALALALIEGEIDAETAAAASQLDERFQVEQWGDDDQASARRAALAADIASAAAFASLLAAG